MKYIVYCLIFVLLFTIYFVLYTPVVFGHEAYVLTKEQFNQGMSQLNPNPFSALQNGENFKIFVEVTLGVLVLIVTYLIFLLSEVGAKFDQAITRLARFGPLITKLTIAASFFFSVQTNSFLGPELSLSSLFFPEVIKFCLILISYMFLLGFLTEVASIAALAIYLLSFSVFGFYMLTYANYLGEMIVLMIFGSRIFSIDKYLFGVKKIADSLQQYEVGIVRVFYGLALCFAAINVKFLHPILSMTVVDQYHLIRFNYLFPQDSLLVALGAALSELTIGVFIILGFELRLAVLVSLFYITLSLLYFKEAVWPHLLLYGISLNLLINKEQLSVDQFLISHKDLLLKIFKK